MKYYNKMRGNKKMRKETLGILLLLCLSIALAAPTTITGSSITSSCSGLKLIAVESTANSHAAFDPAYSYAYDLCVLGNGLQKSSTNGDEVLSLEQSTNSQVGLAGD